MAKPTSLPFEAPETPGPYSVELHFQAAGSDKVYHLSISQDGDGWTTAYANGRRGGTLATGKKNQAPVDYAAARKICNSALNEKVGKGYSPVAGSHLGNGMAAEVIATAARVATGIVPMLLNAIEPTSIDQYIADDRYVAEEKHDGERRLIIVRDGEAIGGNRQGKTVALTARLAGEALALGHSQLVLDGEQIGDTFFCWDVLEHQGRDLRHEPLSARLHLLDRLGINGDSLRVTATAFGAAAKRDLLERVAAAGGEGVVFKELAATYSPGRPNSGGPWVKHKLYQTLTAAVSDVNAQRSVALRLKDDTDSWIPVGNVTIPANHNVPEPGDVVEVRYLYAFDGGSLFQPTYLGKRNDLLLDDCRADQRVFKPAGVAAELDTPAL